MNIAQKSFQLSQIGLRRLTTNSVVRASHPVSKPSNVAPGYAKIQAKYEKFQVDDGVPVHLKGGALDTVLYQITVLLCAVGIGMSGHLFYKLSFPKE